MTVTIKDIAKRAGFSFSTVSRALNDRYGTDPKTLAKIKAVAEEMGYRPNQVAKSLVQKSTRTLGLILPDLSNPYFSTLLSHIRSQIDEAKYSLLICTTDWEPEKERNELKLLLERRCDGVLLYPSDPVDGNTLAKYGIPICVFSEQGVQLDSVFFVGVDNAYCGQLATEHLFDYGYKRPAFLGGNLKSSSSVLRQNSFVKTCQARGYEPEAALLSQGRYTIESGHERATKLLALREERRPDAFFCANDLIAMGAMEAVTLAGYELGTDIGVVGVDNVIYAGLPQIRLTTIDIPLKMLAHQGVDELLLRLGRQAPTTKRGGAAQVADALPPVTGRKNILLKPELVIRETTKVQK